MSLINTIAALISGKRTGPARITFAPPTVRPDPAGERAGLAHQPLTHNPYRRQHNAPEAAKYHAWLAGWKIGRAKRLGRAA